MANRTVKRSIRILHDVLVKVESFIILADLVILGCEVDFEVLLLLGGCSLIPVVPWLA